MKLSFVSLARSIWLFPTEDLNPNGIDLLPVWASLKQRYGFHQFPAKPEEFYPVQGGIQFGKGAFRLEDGQQIEVVNLTIYPDGIVADTRDSTKATDAFIQDVLAFLATKPRMRSEPDMVRRKTYLSEVVVRSEFDLDGIDLKFRKFAELLSESIAENLRFRTSGVRFGTDAQTSADSLAIIFERRQGSSFAEKRYFSQAPVTTEKHMELLDAWERIMGS